MIKTKTKTLVTKPNNNSANAIAPNLIYGCFGGCVNTYCYMSRYNGNRVFVNTNVDEIFQSVVEWAKTYTKIPDQQDPVYKMVDISCNSDLVLMQKHCAEPLIDYLKRYDDHPELNSTMATKYPGLLKLNVNHFNKRPRIRVSLMPQNYSDILEPKMQSIESRVQDIPRLRELGWEVHVNFSPVIMEEGGGKLYEELFKMVASVDPNIYSEVIFLTNHKNQMDKSSDEAKLLMSSSREIKNASGVMRYPIKNKKVYVKKFIELYSLHLNPKNIRYIF